MKTLYFTTDFSAKNITALKEQGFVIRDATAYREGDFLEDCDAVAGDVPQAYLDKYPEAGKGGSDPSDKQPSDMTVAELKAFLDECGVEYDDSAKKSDLLALAEA